MKKLEGKESIIKEKLELDRGDVRSALLKFLSSEYSDKTAEILSLKVLSSDEEYDVEEEGIIEVEVLLKNRPSFIKEEKKELSIEDEINEIVKEIERHESSIRQLRNKLDHIHE